MKYLHKLISQMYLFDFGSKTTYNVIPSIEKIIYHKKLRNIFMLEDKFINNKLKLFCNKFNSNLELSMYKDESFKITLVFEEYVLRVNKSMEQLNLVNILQHRNVDNLEKVLHLDIDVSTNKFIYVTKKYNPIIDPSFISDNILLKFIKDVKVGLAEMEKFGYYHMDVSLDNIVYRLDPDGKITFILIDYDMISSCSKSNNHNIRKSVKDLFEKFKSSQYKSLHISFS